MKSTLKNLFHIPTWCYYFIVIASALALISNLYFFFKIGSVETIMVDGSQYAKGTVEYVKGLKELRQSFILSGLLAIAALSFSIWKLYKRNKNLS